MPRDTEISSVNLHSLQSSQSNLDIVGNILPMVSEEVFALLLVDQSPKGVCAGLLWELPDTFLGVCTNNEASNVIHTYLPNYSPNG